MLWLIIYQTWLLDYRLEQKGQCIPLFWRQVLSNICQKTTKDTESGTKESPCSALIWDMCVCVKARACEGSTSVFTWLMALPVQADRGFSALSQNTTHGHIKGFPDCSAIPQACKTYAQTLCRINEHYWLIFPYVQILPAIRRSKAHPVSS